MEKSYKMQQMFTTYLGLTYLQKLAVQFSSNCGTRIFKRESKEHWDVRLFRIKQALFRKFKPQINFSPFSIYAEFVWLKYMTSSSGFAIFVNAYFFVNAYDYITIFLEISDT